MKVTKPFGVTRRSSINIGRALVIAITFYMVLGGAGTADAQKFRYFAPNISDWVVITTPLAGGTIRTRVLQNQNPSVPPGTIRDIPFGDTNTDSVPTSGDYTGDGLDDYAFYRDDTGTPANTYVIGRSDGGVDYKPFGFFPTDWIGAEGDYDGDDKMDLAIARETGVLQWWVLRSSNNTVAVFNWGNNFTTDFPLPGADYTGDGIDDPTVARVNQTTGLITWYVGTLSGTQIVQQAWGNFATDFIIPGGDYDGDLKADFMVWRGFGAVNGVWYLRTSAGATVYTQFGIPGTNASGVRDTALRAGDYDADGKTDIAIYRPSTMTFWALRSSGGGAQTQPWGIAGNSNLPLASFGTY